MAATHPTTNPDALLAAQERVLTRTAQETRALYGEHYIKHKRMALDHLRGLLRGWLSNGGSEPNWGMAPNTRKHFRK
jgi:hypothetical protein